MSHFTALKNAFQRDLAQVFSSDHDYEKAIDRWAFNAVRRAKVVVFVKGTTDVALAVK